MNARHAPAGAGRFDRVHGDEDRIYLTTAEERELERRALNLIAERRRERDDALADYLIQRELDEMEET